MDKDKQLRWIRVQRRESYELEKVEEKGDGEGGGE